MHHFWASLFHLANSSLLKKAAFGGRATAMVAELMAEAAVVAVLMAEAVVVAVSAMVAVLMAEAVVVAVSVMLA